MTLQRWFSMVLVCPALFLGGVGLLVFNQTPAAMAMSLLLMSGPTLWALEGRKMMREALTGRTHVRYVTQPTE